MDGRKADLEDRFQYFIKFIDKFSINYHLQFTFTRLNLRQSLGLTSSIAIHSTS